MKDIPGTGGGEGGDMGETATGETRVASEIEMKIMESGQVGQTERVRDHSWSQDRLDRRRGLEIILGVRTGWI